MKHELTIGLRLLLSAALLAGCGSSSGAKDEPMGSGGSGGGDDGNTDSSAAAGGSVASASGGSTQNSSNSNTDSGGTHASGGSAGTRSDGSSGGTDTTDAGGTTNNASETTGGSGGGEPIGPGSIQIDDCADLGVKACAQLEACSPFLLAAYYGDVGICEESFAASCSAYGPDLERCGQQIANCTEISEAQGIPASCYRAKGDAMIGGTCVLDSDCAEGLCERAKTDDSGICAEPAGVDQVCGEARRCAIGLRCSAVTYSCVLPTGVGTSCMSPFDCEAGFWCNPDGVCAETNEGDPCAVGISPCSPGQACLLDECRAVTWAEADDSCTSTLSECEGATRCVVEQVSSLERTSSCLPAVGFGEACDDVETTCVEPLVCRSGTCDI